MKLINLGSHATQDMPNVRFRSALIDHLLEVAAFLPVLATWIYILYCYRQSDGDIPSDLYETGGMALFVFILLGAVGYFPLRYINFPFSREAAQCGLPILVSFASVPCSQYRLVPDALFHRPLR